MQKESYLISTNLELGHFKNKKIFWLEIGVIVKITEKLLIII